LRIGRREETRRIKVSKKEKRIKQIIGISMK
jgi:hypothetical protein